MYCSGLVKSDRFKTISAYKITLVPTVLDLKSSSKINLKKFASFFFYGKHIRFQIT